MIRKNTNEKDARKKESNERHNLNEIESKLKVLQTQISGISASSISSVSGAWPVGSVFLSIVSTDPATLLGFGTWERVAEGQFLVGLDSGDADFDTAEETGGAKTVDSSHLHACAPTGATADQQFSGAAIGAGVSSAATKQHVHDVTIPPFNTASGGSETLSIVPPYFVVYIWKRIA